MLNRNTLTYIHTYIQDKFALFGFKSQYRIFILLSKNGETQTYFQGCIMPAELPWA